MSSQHVMPVRTNVTIFVILLVLLFATVGAAYLPLGILHVPIAMTIATAKAVLIVLFFMHLLHSHRLMTIISVASFFWLAIMIALTLNDYLSRNYLSIPGK
jgi:cytochrome c oxidase subunit IV